MSNANFQFMALGTIGTSDNKGSNIMLNIDPATGLTVDLFRPAQFGKLTDVLQANGVDTTALQSSINRMLEAQVTCYTLNYQSTEIGNVTLENSNKISTNKFADNTTIPKELENATIGSTKDVMKALTISDSNNKVMSGYAATKVKPDDPGNKEYVISKKTFTFVVVAKWEEGFTITGLKNVIAIDAVAFGITTDKNKKFGRAEFRDLALLP